jgi:hypothetical protein
MGGGYDLVRSSSGHVGEQTWSYMQGDVAFPANVYACGVGGAICLAGAGGLESCTYISSAPV